MTVLIDGSLLIMINRKLYAHVLLLIRSFYDPNRLFPCVRRLGFILVMLTELDAEVFLEGRLSINEEAHGRSEKQHLNLFDFNEVMMHTDLVHCLKACIIKFLIDFSMLFGLVPFLL